MIRVRRCPSSAPLTRMKPPALSTVRSPARKRRVTPTSGGSPESIVGPMFQGTRASCVMSAIVSRTSRVSGSIRIQLGAGASACPRSGPVPKAASLASSVQRTRHPPDMGSPLGSLSVSSRKVGGRRDAITGCAKPRAYDIPLIGKEPAATSAGSIPTRSATGCHRSSGTVSCSPGFTVNGRPHARRRQLGDGATSHERIGPQSPSRSET